MWLYGSRWYMKKFETLILHFYQDHHDLDYMNELLKDTNIKSVSSNNYDSFISIISFLKPTHVVAPFEYFSDSLLQYVNEFKERMPRSRLAFVRNFSCEKSFSQAAKKYASEQIHFIEVISSKSISACFGFELELLKSADQQAELHKRIKTMEYDFLNSVYHRSLKNLAYLSYFHFPQHLAETSGKMIRNWHSLVGTVRMFDLGYIEDSLQGLEDEAIEIQQHYESIEKMLDEHYTNTLKLLNKLYTPEQLDREKFK